MAAEGSANRNGPDLEDGELDHMQGEARDEAFANLEERPAVPESPPSPSTTVDQVGFTCGNRKDWKKRLQKVQKAGHTVNAALYRSVYGSEAQAEVIIKYEVQSIKVADIQALVLWLMTNFAAECSVSQAGCFDLPTWDQSQSLSAAPERLQREDPLQDLFPNLTKLGQPIIVTAKDPLIRPGYPVALMLNAPFPKEKRQYLRQAAEGLESGCKEGQGQFPPAHYVLKPDMMSRMGYPLPEKLDDGQLRPPDGFVMTQPGNAEGKGSSVPDVLLALDCEMCETSPGVFELTRVSLLNEQKQVLYDELVLPFNSITNYHTNKSGIRAETLQGVTTRLQDVQARFLEMVSADSILVGHALENDLKALKVVHMRCIDTGALFPHPKGLPFRPALRRLSEKFLKRQIQNGAHDPVVDAETALDLAKLKMKHGPAFGLVAQQMVGEPLAEVLMRAQQGCVIIDRADTLNKYLSGCADGISCVSDAEVVEKLTKEVQKEPKDGRRAKFVWAQLRELGALHERRAEEQRQKAQETSAALETAASKPKESQNGETTNGSLPALLRPPPRKRSFLAMSPDDPAKRQRVDAAADVSEGLPVAEGENTHEASEVGEGNVGSAAEGLVAAGEPASTLEMEDGEQEASEDEKLMQQLDEYVGRAYEALLPDSVLVVATCQGNTANARLQHERKIRRSQGLMQPPWTKEDETHYKKEVAGVEQQGVCFVKVKHRL